LKILIGAVVLVLMIGAPSAYAETSYPPPATGANFTDSQDRPCTFGPSHDLCLYQYLERIPGTIDYRDYHSALKVGYTDGFNEGIYHHSTAEDNKTASFSEGYTHGWEKGCVDSGRTQDDCDNQADASTP
jgi:hypothetical protein